MLRGSRASLLNDGRNKYFRIRGKAVLAINRHDGVHVVWHHDERIYLNVVAMSVHALQFRLCNLSSARKLDFAVRDLSEDTGVLVCAHGDEIPTTGAIVPVAKTRALNSVFVLVEGHDSRLSLIISCRAPGQRKVASNVSTTVLFWNLRLPTSSMPPHSCDRRLARLSGFRR